MKREIKTDCVSFPMIYLTIARAIKWIMYEFNMWVYVRPIHLKIEVTRLTISPVVSEKLIVVKRI